MKTSYCPFTNGYCKHDMCALFDGICVFTEIGTALENISINLFKVCEFDNLDTHTEGNLLDLQEALRRLKENKR